MLVKEAKTFGNISTGNTKMPGTTFAIDAFACITGSKLAQIEGTPCHSCYARRLQKIRPSVDKGWKANLSKWKQSKPIDWELAMTMQIVRYNTDNYHRWFDSGDLQSVGMLKSIVNIALATPQIKHWLPTQERQIVADYEKNGGKIPDNLIIRVSASKLDAQSVPNAEHSSTVFKALKPLGKVCEASTRGNNCGPCRACWDKSVQTISYPKHR